MYAPIMKRILAGGVNLGAEDPKKVEYALLVWEGTEARARHRAHAVASAISLDFLMSAEPKLVDVDMSDVVSFRRSLLF